MAAVETNKNKGSKQCKKMKEMASNIQYISNVITTAGIVNQKWFLLNQLTGVKHSEQRQEQKRAQRKRRQQHWSVSGSGDSSSSSRGWRRWDSCSGDSPRNRRELFVRLFSMYIFNALFPALRWRSVSKYTGIKTRHDDSPPGWIPCVNLKNCSSPGTLWNLLPLRLLSPPPSLRWQHTNASLVYLLKSYLYHIYSYTNAFPLRS